MWVDERDVLGFLFIYLISHLLLYVRKYLAWNFHTLHCFQDTHMLLLWMIKYVSVHASFENKCGLYILKKRELYSTEKKTPVLSQCYLAVAAQCHYCPISVAFCETLHTSMQCDPPNNYCLNHYVNNADGSRTINRT